MKKIFTLLVLTLVAISIYASPQFHINKTINSEKRFSVSRCQKAENNKFSALAKQQINAAIANEEQSTTTLNFMGFTKFGYDSKYKDWYMEIHGTDPSTPEYGFRVIMAYYAPADNGFGTFTSEKGQINMADSYIYNPTKGYIEFESAILTTEYKKVRKQFDYMHCDDFAAYLSEMAAKGWHFKAWKAGLVFEKGEPEIVLYHRPGKPKCLAIQGHPEMIPGTPVTKMLNKLIQSLC